MRTGKSHSEAGKLGYLASLEKRKMQHQKKIDDYNKNPNKCKQCGKKFDYNHRHLKFCDNSCAASFNNSGKKRSKKEICYCLFCNEQLKIKQKKFCCIKCQKDYEWEMRKNEIEKNGILPHVLTTNETNLRVVRRYLLEKYGNCCQICKNTEWMGKPIPLVCDHIDGNPENHNIDNFRLVCGNCDMQLPTYKAQNRGLGRAWRRQRYKENKSY